MILSFVVYTVQTLFTRTSSFLVRILILFLLAQFCCFVLRYVYMMAKTAAVVRRTTSGRRAKKINENNEKLPTTKSSLYIEYSLRNDYSGLIPEKIMGVTKKFSQLMFVVKCKKIEKPVVVEAHYMNITFPAMVIQYYESIIEWNNEKND